MIKTHSKQNCSTAFAVTCDQWTACLLTC